MSKIFDVTGPVAEGMWNYPAPFPTLNIKPLPPVPWVKGDVYCEIFEGLHSQSGTYLETPAHHFGNDNPCTYLLYDVPIEKMVDVPCTLLDLGVWELEPGKGRRPITLDELKACPGADGIKEGEAIVVSTGWGRYWFHENYLDGPFFTKASMDWIISKKPIILGSDSARWENLEKPEGFFKDFYEADILMLGPLYETEKVGASRCRLTCLPLKAVKTSCAPCRAAIIVD